MPIHHVPGRILTDECSPNPTPARPNLPPRRVAGARTVMADQWEVLAITTYRSGFLPDGWEPFAVQGVLVWLRRRVVRSQADEVIPMKLNEFPAGDQT